MHGGVRRGQRRESALGLTHEDDRRVADEPDRRTLYGATAGRDPSARRRTSGGAHHRARWPILARGDPANRIGSGDRSGTLGAPTSFRFERWLDGEISESAIGDLFDVARREIGLQGQVNEALDTVEWRARGGLSGAVVSVARRGGRTKVTVHLARTDAAALVVSTSALAGIGAAVGIGAAIGTAAASAGPLGMAGPSRSRSRGPAPELGRHARDLAAHRSFVGAANHGARNGAGGHCPACDRGRA